MDGRSLTKRERAIAAARKFRDCLDCGRVFLSDGPWNRICPPCEQRPHHQASSPRAEPVPTFKEDE